LNIIQSVKSKLVDYIRSVVGPGHTVSSFTNRFTSTDIIDANKGYRGIFFKCLDMRANAISDALDTMTVHRKIKQDEYQEVEFTHPWVTLLNDPTKGIIGVNDLWYITSLNIDLTGEMYFYNDRQANGIVQRMTPIYPGYGFFEVFIDTDGKISRYKYHMLGGGFVNFSPEEITRLYRPHPNAIYKSMSLIEASAYHLDAERFMRIYQRDTAQRGGISATVFTTEQHLNDEQKRKEIKAEASQYMGLKGVGKSMLLWGGVKPIAVPSVNAKDAQFLETLRDVKDDIFILTGVPKGLFENVTTVATANSARIVFARNEVKPTADRYASQLTNELSRAFNANGLVKIFIDDIIPSDFDQEMRMEQQDVEHGVLTINDILRKRGFDEIGAEGDKRFIRAGLLPLDFYADNADRGTEPLRVVKHAPAQLRDDNDPDTAWFRRINRAKNQLYNKNTDIMRQYFLRLGNDVLKSLTERSDKRTLSITVDDLYDFAADSDQIRLLTTEMVRDAITHGWEYAQRRLGRYDIDFDFNSTEMRNIITELTELTKSVPVTTRDKLQQIVEDGIREGLSESELGKKITDEFKNMADYRAQAIARTNTNASFEGSQNAMYQKAGVDRKRWLSRRVGMDRRESHLAADGQEAGIEEHFIIDGEELRYPGDPNGSPGNTINCECTEIPVID